MGWGAGWSAFDDEAAAGASTVRASLLANGPGAGVRWRDARVAVRERYRVPRPARGLATAGAIAGSIGASNVAFRGITPDPAPAIQAGTGSGVDAGPVGGLAQSTNFLNIEVSKVDPHSFHSQATRPKMKVRVGEGSSRDDPGLVNLGRLVGPRHAQEVKRVVTS